LLPHSTHFIRQFLVLVLFVGYRFGEIMCIWDSCVYQKVFFVFLFIKVMYCFVRKYAAIPVQLEIIIIIIIIIIILFETLSKIPKCHI